MKFPLVRNAEPWARLRKHELDERVSTLTRLIERHAGDPDFRRSSIDWRRQLLQYRLELSSLGS